jgi:Copper chaperone
MKTISVPDMMCANCVRRITEAFQSAGLTFSVSLERKAVEVGDDQVPAALSALEDLGFTPRENQ